MSEEQPLRIEDQGAVRVMTLDRPEKKNAFNPALANGLVEGLASAAEDDDVRVVVVTGAGDTFCAGVDVGVFLEVGQGEPTGLTNLMTLHETLRAFPKPIMAAVQGKAVGMGVTLLPHFDLVYAAKGATFLTPFVRLGLVLEYGSSFTLPRLLGRQRANDLVLRGKPIDSAVAEDWGLVTRTFASDELLEATLEVAAEIADNPLRAVRESKRLLQQGEEAALAESVQRENEVLQSCYGSEENLQAVKAFFARKKPPK